MPGQRTQYRRGQGNSTQLPLDFGYGHIQPQAPEVEKAVLGALMIDRDAYMEVCELLHVESFYEPRHQKIFAAIQQLSLEEKPIDVLTVTEQLGRGWRPWLCCRTEFEGCYISQHRVPCQHHC